MMAEATVYQDLVWRKAGSAAGPNALRRLGSMLEVLLRKRLDSTNKQVDEHVESSLTSLADGLLLQQRHRKILGGYSCKCESHGRVFLSGLS